MKRCAWCESKLEGYARRFCGDVCRQAASARVYPKAPPRLRHCFHCGEDFMQGGPGRPRATCGKRACLKSRREWRAAQELPFNAPIAKRRTA